MTKVEFERMFEKYRNGIYKIANSLWATRDDAEDAVARVRAKLLERAGEIRSHGFISLWRTALQNDAVDYLRRRKTQQEALEAAEVQSTAESMVDAGFSPFVLFALTALTEMERYVVIAHAVHNISLKQLTSMLGLPLHKVYDYWRIGRAKLIMELRDYALNYHIINPRDVSEAVEWAARTLNNANQGDSSAC